MTDDRLWYKNAVVYQLRVRSFFDSDGDGVGDFRGLTSKLDYLADLGVDTLWLLPFYPSPLRDDGYDISDYFSIDPELGDLRHFKGFLREAHARGLRVVTELVLNHTSDQHPWFQRARRSPAGSRWRDWYVWSDDPSLYSEARIIFKDFENSNWAWDPVARSYYWHRFYAHQPDLNFDNAEVSKAVERALDFWLEMGVDGLRLDAVPYLFEREGTSCENLPETHAALRRLRAHVDRRFNGRMLLAEANQWPEDAVAYFGSGDECHMAFHFPIMPRLFMALRMEDRFPILDILEQTPAIPEACQWALFLRNHDELTLEMVTDEERDYMYRAYARERKARINLGIRRRLAPLLGNDRRKIELMNALLFALPGTPIVYYGDELGMGDNIFLGDRNGVRTPMQWSPDRNAGFSVANPQSLFLPVVVDPEFHYEAINVETQQRNPNSLLWWMKRLIALRQQSAVFGHGSIEFLTPGNRKVLAFLRRHEDETLLVVVNLSRFAQYVELDLSEFEGLHPRELFGHVRFPRIGELTYLLTLGPYAFHWFSLERPAEESVEVAAGPPVLSVRGSWEAVLGAAARPGLERALESFLAGRRWFRSKTRSRRRVRIVDDVPLGGVHLVACEVEYDEGDAEVYLVLLAFAAGEGEGRDVPVVARLRVETDEVATQGLLVDALGQTGWALALLDAVGRRRRIPGSAGKLFALPTSAFRRLRGADDEQLEPRPLRAEQTNSSIVFGERLVMKLFRKLEEGLNPDQEIGGFLTEGRRVEHVPRVAGAIEYRAPGREPGTVALLTEFVPNEGVAWELTTSEVLAFYERVLSSPSEGAPGAAALVGDMLDHAALLGRRTADLHRALASEWEDPRFSPEPFTPLYRRSLYQSMRKLTRRSFLALAEAAPSFAEAEREAAARVLGLERTVLARFRALVDAAVSGVRIRVHGDFHLGQVLWTGRDFVIIDFEGEPARPLGDRSMKRSPLADVAGMQRSFHYAAESVLRGGAVRDADVSVLRPAGRVWVAEVSRAFLDAWLGGVLASAELSLTDVASRERLLDAFLLEKAIYELLYELDNRPDWVFIPLDGILQRLEDARGLDA